MTSRICSKCHCEFNDVQQICPWCGTPWQPPALSPRLRWLMVIITLTVIASSLGIALTWPLLWDLFFHLGLKRPLQDYSQLEQFLQAEKWQQADQETTSRINQAIRSKLWQSGDGNPVSSATNQIQRLSCADLQVLNFLWLKYSHGRFGFSVQKQIYDKAIVQRSNSSSLALATTSISASSHQGSNNATVKLQQISNQLAAAWGETDQQQEFRRQIGWRLNPNTSESTVTDPSKTSFSLVAPVGHLPSQGVFLFNAETMDPLFSTDAFAKRQDRCGP